MRKIGFHVSISGSIANSVDHAEKLGCNAFQIFSRNPRGWKFKPLEKAESEKFVNKLRGSKIDPYSVVVHMPYLPNLSSPTGDTYMKSIDALLGEIIRCNMLKIPFLVIHLGSHLGKGRDNGIDQIVNSYMYVSENLIKQGQKNNVKILLENSAGQKNSVGSRFSELRTILDKIGSQDVGVCLDTCHMFAAGYDLRTEESVIKTFDEFDDQVGLNNLFVIHLNDSKGDLNSNLDRHDHIGKGKIGNVGMSSILNEKRLTHLPIILETPIDNNGDNIENLEAVRNLIRENI